MEKINLKIDIVSDIVCPWCVIGYKNLKKAISKLEKEIDFKIRWRAYELHPDIPKQGITKEKHIMNKFGDINRAKKTYDHIKKVGERAGFIFHFSKNQTIPNTFLAHRLLWYAEKKDFCVCLLQWRFQCLSSSMSFMPFLRSLCRVFLTG